MKKKTSATSALIALSLSLGFFTNNTYEVLASELEEEIVEVSKVEGKSETEIGADAADAANAADEADAADVDVGAEDETDANEEVGEDTEEDVEEVKEGFFYEDGKAYYYKNGEQATGWIEHEYIGMDWDSETGDYIEVQMSDWYYFNPTTGAMETGWKEVQDTWYYFDELGKMYSEGSTKIDGKEYRFKKSGALHTGWYDNGYYEGYWDYELDEWVETDDWISRWEYYTTDGKVTDGWKKIDGEWYYFEYGSMMTGKHYIEDVRHEFAENGVWLGEVKE